MLAEQGVLKELPPLALAPWRCHRALMGCSGDPQRIHGAPSAATVSRGAMGGLRGAIERRARVERHFNPFCAKLVVSSFRIAS